MLELIDAIDMHTHYNHGSPYDQKIEHPMSRCEIDYLMEEYDSSRICYGAYPALHLFWSPCQSLRKMSIWYRLRVLIRLSGQSMEVSSLTDPALLAAITM